MGTRVSRRAPPIAEGAFLLVTDCILAELLGAGVETGAALTGAAGAGVAGVAGAAFTGSVAY